MVKILIQGINGRMGHALTELIGKREDCCVAAGVDIKEAKNDTCPVYTSFDAVDVPVDAVIDFSSPAATLNAVKWCAAHKTPCVICTTGITADIQAEIDKLAETAPVFQSANMSIGINLLIGLCQKASQVLGLNYDVEIIEKHHHNKLDAPSGTALMIANAINQVNDDKYHYVYERQSVRQARDPYEIGISAVRGGSITGEHEVLFCGPDEVITIQHEAYSRSVFANGAVNAAVFIAGKAPGHYNMSDMISAAL